MTTAQGITTTTEPLARLRSQQVIWPTWMQEATEGLTETSLVEVTRRRTPFGTFVLAIQPAEVTA